MPGYVRQRVCACVQGTRRDAKNSSLKGKAQKSRHGSFAPAAGCVRTVNCLSGCIHLLNSMVVTYRQDYAPNLSNNIIFCAVQT